MTTKFQEFVEEVERTSTVDDRAELDAARRRFSIGSRLLQHRLAAGVTQQQLAETSGVSQADISRIERGLGNPTAQTLESLSAPLGVALDLIPIRN